MSVNGSAFLSPLLSVQWGFPGQQSVGTEAHLDPWEMSFFIFSLWNSGVSLSYPPCCQNLLSPSCLIPPLGSSPGELSQVLPGTVFASATKNTQQTQHPVSDWTMPGNSPSLLQSPGQEKQGWVVQHPHRKHHLHLTLRNAVQRCSPYRSLSQCCLYCYQKKSLQQWADEIVHLTYTRHCFVCSWLSCLLQNHFCGILVLERVADVCTEQEWSDISQMLWITVEMLHRNQERDWDIKTIELRWSQTQAHPCKNITLILWD